MVMKFKETQFGFEWGPVEVERTCSDDAKGWVLLVVKAAKHQNGIQLYVTKTGKVRVYDGLTELLPKAK